jgi:hypothetical protein
MLSGLATVGAFHFRAQFRAQSVEMRSFRKKKEPLCLRGGFFSFILCKNQSLLYQPDACDEWDAWDA